MFPSVPCQSFLPAVMAIHCQPGWRRIGGFRCLPILTPELESHVLREGAGCWQGSREGTCKQWEGMWQSPSASYGSF
jgi:hypothetical protein